MIALIVFTAAITMTIIMLFIALKANAKELDKLRSECSEIEAQIIANANRNDPLVRILLGEIK